MSTIDVIVIVIGIVAAIATLVAITVVVVTWNSRVGFDSTLADEHEARPTDAPSPPGSRPAGPGAEPMNVTEPGDASPGPPQHRSERPRSEPREERRRSARRRPPVICGFRFRGGGDHRSMSTPESDHGEDPLVGCELFGDERQLGFLEELIDWMATSTPSSTPGIGASGSRSGYRPKPS